MAIATPCISMKVLSLIFQIVLVYMFFIYTESFAEICDGRDLEPFVYPGDILIGVFVPIHKIPWLASQSKSKKPSTVELNPRPTKLGFKFLEAIFSAVDEVNARQDYLNYTVGLAIFDSCNHPDIAVKQSINFLQWVDGTNEQFKHLPKEPIMAVIGPAFGDVAMAVANFIKLFEIPQIGYYSATPKLGNLEHFPTSLRTVPSMVETVKAMIKLLRRHDWIYVNVITDNTEYGQSTFEVLAEELADLNDTICLAQIIRLNERLHDSIQSNRLLQKLWQSDASVNLLLTSPQQTTQTIKLIEQWPDRKRNRFLWIGTNSVLEEFPNLDGILEQNKIRENSIVIQHIILILPSLVLSDDLSHYRINLNRDYGIYDWRDTYLLEYCGCIPNGTLTKLANATICDNAREERCLYELHKDSIYYVPSTSNAVYAVASALKRMQDDCMSAPCIPDGSECARRSLMYNMRFFSYTGFSKEILEFYQGIEGYPSYTVISYSSNHSKWEILAEFDAGLSEPFILENPEVLQEIRLTHPYSHCSEPCGLGQARRPDIRNKCCWSCLNCTSDQIVVRSAATPDPFGSSLIPATMCQICEPGKRPNWNQTQCENLPLTYMSIQDRFAIGIVTLCSFGLLVTFSAMIIYAYHWRTPVIRASGRETSVVLLLAILISYTLPIAIVSEKPSWSTCVIALLSPGLCSTISYAAIYARIYRIDRLFHTAQSNLNSPKKCTSQKSQLLVMLLIIGAEGLLLVTTLSLWPVRVKLILSGQSSNVADPLIYQDYQVIILNGIDANRLVCFQSINAIMLIGLLLPVCLMLVSLFHAYKIRKVPSGFNEARSLGFVNYVNVILFILVPLMMHMIRLRTIEMIPLSALLIVTATNQLVVLIIPKIYIVLLKPHKNTQLGVMQKIREQTQVNDIDFLNELDTTQSARFATLSAANTEFSTGRMVPMCSSNRMWARARSQTSPVIGSPNLEKIKKRKPRYYSSTFDVEANGSIVVNGITPRKEVKFHLQDDLEQKITDRSLVREPRSTSSNSKIDINHFVPPCTATRSRNATSSS